MTVPFNGKGCFFFQCLFLLLRNFYTYLKVSFRSLQCLFDVSPNYLKAGNESVKRSFECGHKSKPEATIGHVV